MTVKDNSERSGPLKNVKVIDMSSSYAAPTAAMYLADMGADVIKIEPLRGDDARQWGPPFVGEDAAWYLTANRGKRSACLNIRSSLGIEGLYALLGVSDVLLLNIVPTKLASLGLDPQEIHARFPALVVCVVSGHGIDGPDAGLPGYDLIAQAKSGVMSVTGELDGTPQRVSAPLSDVAAGTVAAFAISAALVRQQMTGNGDIVDISLAEADLAFVRPRITSVDAGDEEPKPSGGRDSVVAIYQAFETRDKPLVVAIGNDRQWDRARSALELPEWTGAHDLATNADRRRRRTELTDAVQTAISPYTRAEALDLFNKAGIPAAPINFISDVLKDEQFRARGALIERRTRTGEGYLDVAPPWKLHSMSRDANFEPPAEKGAHTREVLEEAGLAEETIASLLRDVTATVH